MSAASDRRTAEFLAIADQFRLGHLVTESAHPLTRDLSGAAEAGVDRALELLFAVDADVVEGFRRFTASGLALEMGNAAAEALSRGGRLFFTGCGATGRLSIQLDSIWRKYWRRMDGDAAYAADMADRTFSVMAGGDFALIKSVEGFEDYASFGKKQITDLGVGPGDVVFAITEGGETSFVIGTAWAGLEAGAKVYFVYNNPDDLLRSRVARSREVLDDDRIRNVNLTTGPMAIRGSTRMQATSSELIAMVTVLETALCLLLRSRPEGHPLTPERVGPHTLAALEQAHAELKAPSFVCSLARLATLEEAAYRCGAKATYHADGLGIDVLTDTTERSPTFCTAGKPFICPPPELITLPLPSLTINLEVRLLLIPIPTLPCKKDDPQIDKLPALNIPPAPIVAPPLTSKSLPTWRLFLVDKVPVSIPPASNCWM